MVSRSTTMTSVTVGSASRSSSGPRPSTSSASSLRRRPRSSPLGSSRACSSSSSSMSCRTRGASALSCSSSGAQRRQIERLEQEAAQPALQAIALGVAERSGIAALTALAPAAPRRPSARLGGARRATLTSARRRSARDARRGRLDVDRRSSVSTRRRRRSRWPLRRRRRPRSASPAAMPPATARARAAPGGRKRSVNGPTLIGLPNGSGCAPITRLPVDEGAVGRQIAHHQPAGGDLDRRVPARHVVVLEHHRRVRGRAR